MKRCELDQIRQLIRERNRLPDAPRPRWSELAARAEAEPDAAGAAVPEPAEATAPPEPDEVFAGEPPALRLEAEEPTSTPADAPQGEAAADAPETGRHDLWEPDELVLRLVELLIDMRALAGADAPRTSSDRAAA